MEEEEEGSNLYEVVESGETIAQGECHHNCLADGGREETLSIGEKAEGVGAQEEEEDAGSYEVVLPKDEEDATGASSGCASGGARRQQQLGAAVTSRSRKLDVGRELYWNHHFQEALCMEDSIQKFSRLSHIANDFQLAAKTYAQIIVSELNLPHDRKTIKPDKRLGGVAGGLKYIVQNILFKFALDTPRPQRPGKWMYGDDRPEDHNAIKVAAHELKSAISLLSVRPSNLCLPLMTLVDYRGFRLTAISILPISKEENTLVYGSADQGKTIRNDDADAMDAIRQAITRLNLNERVVREQLVWGPVDLEVHRGKDGRIYVLDMARIFPPDFVLEERHNYHSRAPFFQLLRPELVRRSSIPLCSDAFSAFNHPRFSPNASQYNEEVSAMSRRLVYAIIPAFVRKAHELLALLEDSDDEMFFRGSGSIREEVEKRHQVLRKLCKDMHSWGINLRYFGRVRRELHRLVYAGRENASGLILNKKWEKNFRFLDSLLLTEMTTRVVKDIFHEQMRNKVKKVEVLSEEPYHQAAIKLFNLIIGTCSPKCELASNLFWTRTTYSPPPFAAAAAAPAFPATPPPNTASPSVPDPRRDARLRRERRNTPLGMRGSFVQDTTPQSADGKGKDGEEEAGYHDDHNDAEDDDSARGNTWNDEDWDEHLGAVTHKSMKDRLMGKFGSFALDPEEAASTFDLRNILSIRLLFIRLQELASLEFARHAEQQLLTSPHTFAFVEGDLLALNPRIKHMNLVDLASGRALYLQAMQILEERRNKNRGRKEAKRLLGLAQLRLANALSSATVEDVMDDCALLLVRVLFEYCRIDEDWQNVKTQQLFEAAVKQLKEVLKREKIKQNIKDEEQDRHREQQQQQQQQQRGESPPLSRPENAPPGAAPGTAAGAAASMEHPPHPQLQPREQGEQGEEEEQQQIARPRGAAKGPQQQQQAQAQAQGPGEAEEEGRDERGRGEGWQEMSYLWGMIFYEWGMRKLYVDSTASSGGTDAASSSSSTLSGSGSAAAASSSFLGSAYHSDSENDSEQLPRAIQKMFEEAEGWLVRAIKGDSHHALPSVSSSVYKRVEKDVHGLWEWAEKETGRQAVCLLCLAECDRTDNKAWLLWATTIGMLDMRVEGSLFPARWNSLLQAVTSHSSDHHHHDPAAAAHPRSHPSPRTRVKGKRWLRQSIDSKVEIALRDKDSVVAFCNSLSLSQRHGIIAALRPRSGSFARALHLLFSSADVQLVSQEMAANNNNTAATGISSSSSSTTTTTTTTSNNNNEGMTDVEEDRSRPGDANGQRPPVEQPALPSVPNKPPLTRSLSKMPKDQRTSRERLSWSVRKTRSGYNPTKPMAEATDTAPDRPLRQKPQPQPPPPQAQQDQTGASHQHGEQHRPDYFDDYAFERLLGSKDKERVWWAAVSKPLHGLGVTIQKTMDINPATCSDLLTSAKHLRTSLRHANVARLYDCFAVGNELWQVMQASVAEYSLKQLLQDTRSKTLHESTVAAILQQVGEGLNYLHQNGLIGHDQFSSSNLFVDRSTGTLLLMNSVEGHLKQSAHKLDTFASQDTYAYSAPEVCGVKNKPTRVADTYALGILSLELATGQAPFSDMNILLQMNAKARRPSPALHGEKWSPAFREFVDACLQKEPAKRPTVDEVLKHRFFDPVRADSRGPLLQHLASRLKDHSAVNEEEGEDDDDEEDSDVYSDTDAEMDSSSSESDSDSDSDGSTGAAAQPVAKPSPIKGEVPPLAKTKRNPSSSGSSSSSDSDSGSSSESEHEENETAATGSKYAACRPRALYDSLAFPATEARHEAAGKLAAQQGGLVRREGGGGGGGGGGEGWAADTWKRETETEVVLLLRTCEGTQIECTVREDGQAIVLAFSAPPLPIDVRALLRPTNDDDAGDDSAFQPHRRTTQVPLAQGRAAGGANVPVEDTHHPGIKVVTVKKLR